MRIRNTVAVAALALVLPLAGCGDGPAEPDAAPPAMLSAETLDPLQAAYDDVVSRLLPAMDPDAARAVGPAVSLLRPALARGEVRGLESAVERAWARAPGDISDPDAAAAMLLLGQIGRTLDARQSAFPETREDIR